MLAFPGAFMLEFANFMTRQFKTCFGSAATSLAFSVSVITVAAATADQNWPQWRGPRQDGVAPLATPPTTWSETNNVKWKVKIPGGGMATPIIWDNRIYVQTAIPTGKKIEPASGATDAPPARKADAPDAAPRPGGAGKKKGGFGGGRKPTEAYQFVVLCLDRQTGQVIWQQVAKEELPHEGRHPTEGSFASSSGITDGKHIFAWFGSRGLYCYDLDGKLEWKQDFGKMRIRLTFGEGSSPAMHGDSLIINWDNEEGSFITALDKNSGKTLWKKPREEQTSWSTPLVVEQNGKAQVVVSATGKIRDYDLASGDLVWECAGLTRNAIPSPVSSGGTVYCMTGYSGSALLAIRLGRTGDLTGGDAIAWSYKKNTPYVPSPLLYGNKLYFFSVNTSTLSCLDTATGQPLIDAQKLEDLSGVYASPLGADSRVYLPGRNGVTVVLKHSDKLEVLATNRLDEKFDASPAAVGKELFLRGYQYLYCLAEK
jgi:outer membrane protein assembly factor BamB